MVEQNGADDYHVIATIPTKPGAKTARFVPELNKYYVGVPAKDASRRKFLYMTLLHDGWSLSGKASACGVLYFKYQTPQAVLQNCSA